MIRKREERTTPIHNFARILFQLIPHLHTSQSRTCISLLHKLPRKHFSCGLVQQLLGKAYFEAADYKPALLALKDIEGIAQIYLDDKDVIRHRLVKSIISAYKGIETD